MQRVIDGRIDSGLLQRIGEEQSDLSRYLVELDEVEMAPAFKDRMKAYIRLTQALLSKTEAVSLKSLEPNVG